MRDESKAVMLCIVICALMTMASAADSTPQLIRIQGYLSDMSGGTKVPAEGSHQLSFELFDDEFAGLAVAPPVTMPDVDVLSGHYEVALPFPASVFDGTVRWLAITVNGELLQPRIRITSTPYAYVADKLDGLDGSDVEESAEIQDEVANLQGQIDGLATAGGNTLDEAYNEGGDGAGRTINARRGAVTIDGPDGLIVTQRIGIVDSPTSFVRRFQVGGDIQGIGIDGSNASPNAGFIRFGDRTGWRLHFGRSRESQGGPLNMDATGATMTLVDTGEVGIGTQSPLNTFHVVGNAGLFVLEGTDHAYAQFFPDGLSAGRKAWVGFGGAADVDFTVANEFGGAVVLSGSRTRVNILQITGGADIAEPFETNSHEAIAPGSVLIIDDKSPGILILSTRPYDTRVAGIASGAGGVRPGLTLSQEGIAEGEVNVAMAGRVYALCTAANGPIRPGDLLTTSQVSGHAMRATDMSRAPGAIIGKAMSTLDHGEGLVLVLASLH